MIRLIDGLPDGVVGFEGVGHIDAGDYKSTLDPAINAALESHDKIRLLYVLGDEFEGYSGGAMWEDTRLGMTHWSKWERVAVVTDHGAMRDTVNAFGWMVPGDVKTFALADLDAAKAWLAE